MKKRAAEETATLETSVIAQETTVTPERVLIESDPYKTEKARGEFISYGQPALDQAYQAFKTLNCGTLTIAELISMATARKLENYVRDYLYENNPTLIAFPISKETLMAGMELPENFRQVQQAFDNIRDMAMDSNRWYHSLNPISAEYYQLNAEDQVEVNAEALDAFLDSLYNKYITEPGEIAAYHELKKAFEIIKAIADKSPKQAVIDAKGSGIIGIDFYSYPPQLAFRPKLIPGLFTPGRY